MSDESGYRKGGIASPMERRSLSAGPISADFCDGDLRYIRCRGYEIVRRVYLAVRDPEWGTLAGEIADVRFQEEQDSFAVAYTVRYSHSGIDLACSVRFSGTTDGRITAVFDAAAGSSFQSSRIGFCVLYPIRECQGKPFVATHNDGSKNEETFPLLVSPHQPCLDISQLEHRPGPGLTCTVKFSGDVFEMEDQRNWTDASYKVYSRPLSLPKPFDVGKGDQFHQEIDVKTAVDTDVRSVYPEGDCVDIRVSFPGTGPKFPDVGTAMGPRILESPEGAGWDAIARMGLSHLRVDMHPADGSLETQVSYAAELQTATGTAAEVALLLSENLERDLPYVRSALENGALSVGRWIVLSSTAPMPSADEIDMARRILSPLNRAAAFGIGTTDNFCTLNRNRPSNQKADFLCYPVHPQVHAFDDTSLIENCEGNRWPLETATSFRGNSPVSLSSVTFNRELFDGKNAVDDADPRQGTQFGACWTFGSLKYLAQGGASSITFFEGVGPHGMTDGKKTYPLYHVISDACDMQDWRVERAVSDEPPRVESLCASKGGMTILLLANMTGYDQKARICGIEGVGAVRSMDETTMELSATDHTAFRACSHHSVVFSESGTEVGLRPYAYQRIEIGR